MRWTLAFALIGLMAACASDSTDEGTSPTKTWTSADYKMTANKVTDGCLDGAASSIAIPNGMTREFTNPLTFPGSADDTFTTKLKLVSPFSEVDVTFKKQAGTDSWKWDPAPTNTGVDLGELDSTWAGCTADFQFDGDFSPVELPDGSIKFEGVTSFIVTGTNDNAACPTFANPTPCNIDLDMSASL